MYKRILPLLYLNLLSGVLLAQSFFGTVKNESGTPIENASVFLVEDKIYTTTDAEGKWNITAKNQEEKTLVFHKENLTYEQLVQQTSGTETEIILRAAISSAATLREDDYILNGCATVNIPDDASWNVGFKISELKGDLAPDKNYTRRDPSAVIKVDGKYYVYYSYSTTFDETKLAPWDRNDIYFASSSDGVFWEELGAAVNRGPEGAFDARSVFTTEIFVHNGKYYLVYQAAKDEDGIYNRNTVGMSFADSPEGPWTKLETPILHPTYTDDLYFDNNAVHDPCLIFYNSKFYLYYKGECNCLDNNNCNRWCNPVCGLNKQVKWGVAIANVPEGPYVKSEYNPVTNTGHEVMVWPYKNGVAILQHQDGPEANSIQFSEDGFNFHPKGRVSNIPEAAGLFRAPVSDNNPHAGIEWGLGHKLMWNAGPKGWMYLYRFDIVDDKPSGFNVIPQKIQLGKGQEKKLSVKTEPFSAAPKHIKWWSENENIAHVQAGKVTAFSEGRTTVFASINAETVVDSCEVVVQKENFDEALLQVAANAFKSTGGTFNDAGSGGPGFGVKKNANEINFVNKNDWCIYDIYVQKPGVYELKYEISTPMESPEIRMEINNTEVAKDKVFTNGAWSSYYTLISEGLAQFETAGSYEAKIIASGADTWQWNLKSFSLSRLCELSVETGMRNTFSKNIRLFANPAENRIFITGVTDEYRVSLYSVLGQCCYFARHNGNSVLHINPQLSGTYVIKVQQNNEVFTTKVLL